jgi:hypothetical protein
LLVCRMLTALGMNARRPGCIRDGG